jgi:hypothetical protein
MRVMISPLWSYEIAQNAFPAISNKKASIPTPRDGGFEKLRGTTLI